jgi:hypothetical protein
MKVDRAVRRVSFVQAYIARGKTTFVFECFPFLEDENCPYEIAMLYVCPDFIFGTS